jgi:hypothetical protein
MRVAVLCLLTCTALTWVGSAQEQSPAADGLVRAAREALGGAQRIASLRSFVTTGRTRQVQGDNLVPVEFEMACEWPDKCYRRDEIPARESGPTTLGFNGDQLIQLPVPQAPPTPPAAAGRPGGPPVNPEAQRQARVVTVKQDFARLLLGMIAGTIGNFPVTFTHAGDAEAPQGKAEMLDVKGPNNFAARLFVMGDSHLPVMISWQAPPAPGRGGRPGGPGPVAPPAPSPQPAGGAPPAGARPGGPPAAPALVENRIYFADYRESDGFRFPYRLRRAVGSDTIEETTFDRFRVNVKIDPKKFEVRK